MNMNESGSPFRVWLTDRYHTIAAIYRRDLTTIVNTCREYAEGNRWEQRHHEIAVGLLEGVARPATGRYAGEVSTEDRQWFDTVRKVDWEGMLQDAIKDLPQVNSAAL